MILQMLPFQTVLASSPWSLWGLHFRRRICRSAAEMESGEKSPLHFTLRLMKPWPQYCCKYTKSHVRTAVQHPPLTAGFSKAPVRPLQTQSMHTHFLLERKLNNNIRSDAAQGNKTISNINKTCPLDKRVLMRDNCSHISLNNRK